MRHQVIALTIAAALLLLSCQTDSYEKGEGYYSLMQVELCELQVDGKKQGVAFVTDDGDSYQLAAPVTTKWIQTADTTYRAIIYFNKVDHQQAQAIEASAVATLRPVALWRFKKPHQDPMGYESGWLARSGKYLNVGVLMKTGRIDNEEPPHSIALAQDTVLQYADGRRTAHYRLLHSQEGAPEYYTNRRYISIALPQPVPDTIHFHMQTYDGALQRTFVP